MERALQPAAVPPGFLEQVKAWASNQPDPVSVFLFGSRARGDCGPESDWDLALVHEGECPSLSGLPEVLEAARIDWVPLERAHVLSWLNLCGVQNAVASSGICLLGDPLPKPERSDVNVPMTWQFLVETHKKMSECVQMLGNYWQEDPDVRLSYDSSVARHSANSAEYLCKAVLHLRGIEPKYIHTVNGLCKILERESPSERLLPALKKCNKQTKMAHDGAYQLAPLEPIKKSADRLCRVARLIETVLPEACDETPAEDDYGFHIRRLSKYRRSFRERVDDLGETACPPETVQKIKKSADYWPSIADLEHRLNTPTLEEIQEQQRRQAGRATGTSRGR